MTEDEIIKKYNVLIRMQIELNYLREMKDCAREFIFNGTHLKELEYMIKNPPDIDAEMKKTDKNES